MTVGWSGLQFTHLRKVAPLIGFFNGSVAPAGRLRPCRTSLLCSESRVLRCSSSAAIVFDRPTGRVARFCVSCQLVVPHDGVSPPPQPPVPPVPVPPPDNDLQADWFSHGPLSRFPSPYGWGRGDPTPPGSGTQSWLFCPLISLGLALAESRLGVPPYSTGNREQVPSEQSQFWTANALPIIRAYAAHFHSLDQPARRTCGLCRTRGCHPPGIMSMIAVWLSDTVTHFRQGCSSLHASAPPPLPFPPPPDVPQPCHPVDPPSATSQAPSPFTVVPSPSPPRSPFASLPPSTALLQGILTFLLLWLQDSLLSTLLHHLLSPRLLFSWIPASLRNLSLAHLG